MLAASLASFLSSAQQDIPLSIDRLSLKGVVANATDFQGRRALRLLEADQSRNALGLAIVNGLTMRDNLRCSSCLFSATHVTPRR
jgi:hypothetical protein